MKKLPGTRKTRPVLSASAFLWFCSHGGSTIVTAFDAIDLLQVATSDLFESRDGGPAQNGVRMYIGTYRGMYRVLVVWPSKYRILPPFYEAISYQNVVVLSMINMDAPLLASPSSPRWHHQRPRLMSS